MTVFTAIIEQTRYTLEVPWMPALGPLTAGLVVAGALAHRRTRGVVRAVCAPLSLVCGAFVFMLQQGAVMLFDGRSFAAGAVFSTVFVALGLLWAAVAFCAANALVALATILLLPAPQRRADDPAALDGPALPARAGWGWALPGLLLVLAGALVARTVRAQIGPSSSGLPRLLIHGAERGQRDERYPIETILGYPAVPGFIFGTPERPLSSVEATRANAQCSDCSFEFTPTQIGPHHRVIRARYYGYALERDWRFTATDNHGDPRLPLRVGARWIFRARHEGSTVAGGWGVAIADRRLSHLAPRDVGRPRLGDERLEFSVDSSQFRDGVRHFHLSFAASGERSHAFWVYAQDGQTWLSEGAQPLIRDRSDTSRAAQLPAGLYACRVGPLPLSLCSDGSNPNLPPGPIWGVRDSNAGTGLLVTLLTLGAVIPGSGPRSSWCFERFIPGTGDAVRTIERAPLAPTSAPEAERLALCEPSAQALAASRPSAPSRSSRPRVRGR